MPKRVLQGVIVSDKADKTVVVQVEQRLADKRMGKIIRRSKKYHAHDAANERKLGERVRIRECRPISRLKHWVVLADDAPAGGTPAGEKPAPAAAEGDGS